MHDHNHDHNHNHNYDYIYGENNHDDNYIKYDKANNYNGDSIIENLILQTKYILLQCMSICHIFVVEHFVLASSAVVLTFSLSIIIQ